MAIETMRFWCQKVLPLVYDNSLSYYEVLNKVAFKLNEVIEKINTDMGNIERVVTQILTEWLNDGTLEDIIGDTLDHLDSRTTKLESEAIKMMKSLGVVKGKNVVFIGDSWTVGSGATNPSTERFSTLMAEKFGMTEFNFGVGGAGFTITNNTFYSQLETASNSMTSAQKSNTTLVCIVGGVNDLRHAENTTREAFIGACATVARKAISEFPNALIVMAIGTTVCDSVTDTNRHWIYSANRYVKRVVTEGNVVLIDHVGSALNGVSANYTGDKFHPTTLGHSILAGFLANAIMGGNTETEYYIGTYTLDDTVVEAVRVPHVFRQTENVLYGEGIIKLKQDISTNTLIGTYTGAFGYDNIYLPVYHGDVPVASISITTNGNVRIIPYTDMTLLEEWQLRIPDHVELFRSLIE